MSFFWFSHLKSTSKAQKLPENKNKRKTSKFSSRTSKWNSNFEVSRKLDFERRQSTKFKRKLSDLTSLNSNIPVIEHKRRRVGAFPEYWLIIPWLCARGVGMLKVIALWNLRRRGSTVTTGDTATPRPSSLAVKSGSMGCAWGFKKFSRE